jgi:hypothetical protein
MLKAIFCSILVERCIFPTDTITNCYTFQVSVVHLIRALSRVLKELQTSPLEGERFGEGFLKSVEFTLKKDFYACYLLYLLRLGVEIILMGCKYLLSWH